MNKSKRIISTFFTTGMATILGFAINFFLTPVITNKIGIEAYGFVSLAKTIINYALILTIALNSYASRFIALEYHKDNKIKSNQYMSSVFWGNTFLGTVFLVIVIFLIPVLDDLLSIPPELSSSVKILFVLIFISFSLTCISTSFTASAYIKNRLDIAGVFKILSYLVEAGVLFVSFMFFEPYVWYVGLALVLSHLVLLIGNILITRKLTPDLHVKRKDFSWKAMKELVLNGIWNSINSLGNTLNAGLDLIICNIYLTSMQMGQLAVAKTLLSIFSAFYATLAQPFHPIFLKDYSDGNKKQLLTDLKLSMKFSGGVINIIFAGFIALGIPFFHLWIPKQDIGLIYNLTLLTILTSVSEGAVYPLYYIYTLTVKNKIPCIITLIGGVLNVLGMIILLNTTNIGVYGIVLTTTVIMTIINMVTNPLYMAHVLELPWYTFFPGILRNVLSCGILVLVFKLLSFVYLPNKWITLILCALIYAMIGVVIHFVVVGSRKDWAIIKRKLLKH